MKFVTILGTALLLMSQLGTTLRIPEDNLQDGVYLQQDPNTFGLQQHLKAQEQFGEEERPTKKPENKPPKQPESQPPKQPEKKPEKNEQEPFGGPQPVKEPKKPQKKPQGPEKPKTEKAPETEKPKTEKAPETEKPKQGQKKPQINAEGLKKWQEWQKKYGNRKFQNPKIQALYDQQKEKKKRQYLAGKFN